MNRKTKEIALLTAPVIAIVALIPGARWLNDWRVAREVPRVTACVTRAPTAWEASQGATVGYTARAVVPDSGGPFWSGRVKIRNAQGQHWASDAPGWNRVAVASDYKIWGNSPYAGDADDRSGDTIDFVGGLKWKQIAGNSAGVWAEVSVWAEGNAPQRNTEMTRKFALKSSAAPPVASLRRANFELKKVQMTTVAMGNGLQHRFSFVSRFLGQTHKPRPQIASFDLWHLWKLNLDAGNRTIASTFEIESDAPQATGLTAICMKFDETVPMLHGKPAHLAGPLFIYDGWPQLVRVQLPQGLPTKIGTTDLAFTSQLAPLPK